MNNYIALTLGPINRVISLAKTTRGMWAASYLFSYLAKHIMCAFKDRTFILPYIESDLFSAKYAGAGVFPDRYIFKTEEGDFDKLAEQIQDVITTLAKELAPQDVDCAKTMLLQYLKFYFFQTEQKEGEDDKSLVKRCEKQLTLLEQQDSLIPSIPKEKHYLSCLVNSEKLAPMQFLLDDAGINKFKSIVDVSSGEDGNYTIEPQQPYQRYIAIVSADGDSMGKAFSEADDSGKLSKQLLQFNKDAVEAIKKFDGQPVYIGGDDLFFFAPIFNPDKGSLFTLLNSLDNAFHNALGENSPATLSFGVTITYYKYPMSEAVKLSQSLLKKAKGNNPPEDVKVEKNNVLFAIQKHSGQTRSALLHKGCKKTIDNMIKLIDGYTNVGNNDKSLLLSSIMHNMREHEPILLNAVKDKSLLNSYFDYNYNEPIHKTYKSFINNVSDFLSIAYMEYKDRIVLLKRSIESPIKDRPKGYDAEYASLDLCYAILQFIHLLNAKNNEI